MCNGAGLRETLRFGNQDSGLDEVVSLGNVIACLARDKLEVKYYVNLWENELKRIYYGGDYYTGSPDSKVK